MKALQIVLVAVVITAMAANAQDNSGYIPNRIIVKPRNVAAFRDQSATGLKSLIDVPVTVREIAGTESFVIETGPATASRLLSTFSAAQGVFEYVQPDSLFTSHAVVMPEDPEFLHSPSQLWGLYAVSAPKAWLRGQGDTSVVAAIMDTGIDQSHEDLVENLWTASKDFRVTLGATTIECKAGDFGYDAIDDDCRPEERQEHGTNVSGIVGAKGDNEKGTVGVNWKVSLLPVAFMDAAQAGSASHAAKALAFIRTLKEAKLADVRVINLSWGAHHHSRVIEDELIRLAGLGVVIVTSAGNEASDNDLCPIYPAGYDSVSTLISVAATRSDGNIARSSNRGRRSIDIAAPGIGIRTTDPGNSYDSPFGTSMAAAMVTGAVALLASQCRTLTGEQLKRLILDNADRKPALDAHVIGGRFLNVLAASNACASVPPTPRDGLH